MNEGLMGRLCEERMCNAGALRSHPVSRAVADSTLPAPRSAHGAFSLSRAALAGFCIFGLTSCSSLLLAWLQVTTDIEKPEQSGLPISSISLSHTYHIQPYPKLTP